MLSVCRLDDDDADADDDDDDGLGGEAPVTIELIKSRSEGTPDRPCR